MDVGHIVASLTSSAPMTSVSRAFECNRISSLIEEQLATIALISMYPRTTTDVSREQMLCNVNLHKPNWHSVQQAQRQCWSVSVEFWLDQSTKSVRSHLNVQTDWISFFEQSLDRRRNHFVVQLGEGRKERIARVTNKRADLLRERVSLSSKAWICLLFYSSSIPL